MRHASSPLLRTAFSALLLAATLLAGGPAAADLLVAPTRVQFDEKTQSASVTLNNTAAEPRTYRVEFIEYTAQEDGSYLTPEQPRPDSVQLQRLLRYSPRQVTLGPGESQSVRFLLRGGEAPQGEMRTHVRFVTIPPEAAPKDGEAKPAEGIQFDLKFALAVSIPVVYRPAGGSATAAIEAPTVVAAGEQKEIRFAIARTGTQSLYGDCEIVSGNDKVIGLLRGVAVYLEQPRRSVRVPLDLAAKDPLPAGTRIRYRLPSDQGGTVLAEIPVGS
ncbi:MAG TPA: fimbria/pilus periplasmic chaperone [Azospirillaceae bacterium]|nr:fimbria/pilus periplasmic chaperone [Azospirillaceae bacterium]